MPTSIAGKLKIKEGFHLFVAGEPADFFEKIGMNCSGGHHIKEFDQLHWFVKNRKEFETGIDGIMKKLPKAILCWIYFPKRTSKIQTDLSRDEGWEALNQYENIQWISLISYDDTWSAFAVRKQEENVKTVSKAPADLSAYIDRKQKTVIVPKDLADLFKKHKKEEKYFTGLAYSHKKEYIEWILNSRKEATRKRRMEQMMERLSKQLKNPSDK